MRIELRLGEEVPRIWADAGQFEQILLNLAVNARDAMPDGGRLTISTAATTFAESDVGDHPDAQAGPFACLSITDTGCGIPQDVLKKIFDPFFTTKAKGKGTGLGLSTVYGIVRQQGGWVHVYSQVGQGTTFKVYLPAAKEEAVTRHAGRAAKEKLRDAVHAARILVVEDEAAIGRIAERVLASRGHSVDVVSGIADARAAWRAESSRYDLVFSDVVLPDGNGVALAEELTPQNPRLRILLASGYADERSRWTRIQEKGWKCLLKPYSTQMLLDAVDELLSDCNDIQD